MQIEVGNEYAPYNVLWQPNPGPQTEFCQTTADYALFGGARGGGKTDCLLAEATRYGNYPDYKALFLRRTFPQLSEVMERAKKLYEPLGWKWEGESRLWRAPGGGFVQFGHCQHESDRFNYIGKEFQRIFYDQVERFTLLIFQEVNTTLRSTNPDIKTQVLASANPGGIGHTWCKNMWIDRCPPRPRGPRVFNEAFNVDWQPVRAGEMYTDEYGETWQYYPALVFDNPYLIDNDPKYVRKLLALPYESREAYLWGNWEVFVGQFFSEFRRDIHVLTAKEIPKIPKTWNVFGGCDYASSGWYFSGAAAVTHNAELVFCEEDYFKGGSIKKKAARADRLIEKYPQMKRWAAAWDMFNEIRDRDTEQVQGRIIDRFQKHLKNTKVQFVKAPKERVPGWDLIREGLSWQDGDKPWLYVMDTCPKLIETIQAQVHSETDPEDLDSDGWTHGVDFMRYVASVAKREKKNIPTDAYEQRQKQKQPRGRKHWLLN